MLLKVNASIHSYMFATSLFPRWMKGITLETILSSAFGVQSKVQTNPDDIVAKYAKQSVSAGTLVMVIAMIPVIGPKMAKYIMPTDYGFGYGKLTTISEGIIKQRKQQGIENNPKKVNNWCFIKSVRRLKSSVSDIFGLNHLTNPSTTTNVIIKLMLLELEFLVLLYYLCVCIISAHRFELLITF